MKHEPQVLEGTALDAAELKKKKVFKTIYVPKLRYGLDQGEALSRFLKELKQGRLIARRCRNCQRVLIPPRMFCEICFRPTDEWSYVKDTGRVMTFSLCYVSWDVKPLKHPEIPAVIEIDGASAGMGILHLVRKISPKRLRIGMRVRAVWKPASQRIGSITDIAYWKPLAQHNEKKRPRKK